MVTLKRTEIHLKCCADTTRFTIPVHRYCTTTVVNSIPRVLVTTKLHTVDLDLEVDLRVKLTCPMIQDRTSSILF